MNELQKQAMIDFCTAHAGEIKYVPEFNEQGRCTVKASITAEIARRQAKTLSNSCGPKEGQGLPSGLTLTEFELSASTNRTRNLYPHPNQPLTNDSAEMR